MVYVTAAAADRYARWAGIEKEPERARRELTGLLLDAREHTSGDGRWRYRNRVHDCDITARVVVEDRLAIVVSIDVREYSGYPRER